MIITINNDTNGTELYHLSILFQSLAKAHGFVVPVETQTSASQTSTVGEMSVTLNVDTANATSAVEALADLIDRTGVKVEDVPPVTVSVVDQAKVQYEEMLTAGIVDPVGTHPIVIHRATNDNLDSSGLPWDARIHAGSRERNTDGSWRVRRRPKGVEEAEWDATLTRVTSELRDLMEIPVTPGAVADAAAETALTDAEVDQFVEIMDGITDDTPAPIAPPVILPPVVLPPVTITPPTIATETTPIDTFARVMTYLTARTPKVEAEKPAMVAKVNEILAANGLTVLTQLGQRPDLIPQIMAEFTAAFGE
jgi:hypothetical protein